MSRINLNNINICVANESVIHSTFKKMILSPTSFESTELTEIINDKCALRTL